VSSCRRLWLYGVGAALRQGRRRSRRRLIWVIGPRDLYARFAYIAIRKKRGKPGISLVPWLAQLRDCISAAGLRGGGAGDDWVGVGRVGLGKRCATFAPLTPRARRFHRCTANQTWARCFAHLPRGPTTVTSPASGKPFGLRKSCATSTTGARMSESARLRETRTPRARSSGNAAIYALLSRAAALFHGRAIQRPAWPATISRRAHPTFRRGSQLHRGGDLAHIGEQHTMPPPEPPPKPVHGELPLSASRCRPR